MLTNVLFGQPRSGVAEPASAKATENAQRQQANRSFSDHMDDRARRDDAKAASERERVDQGDKPSDRKDAGESAKAGDQTQSRDAKSAGKAPQPSRASTAASEAEVDGSDFPAEVEGEALDLGEETAEITPESLDEVSAEPDGEITADVAAINAAEDAAQNTDLPPVALGQVREAQPSAAQASKSAEASIQTPAPGGAGTAQPAAAAGDGDELPAQPTLAEAAPESMNDLGDVDVETASRVSTQPASGVVTAAGTAATTAQNATAGTLASGETVAAAADDFAAAPSAQQDPEVSDKPQAVSATLTGATRPQTADLRTAETRTTATAVPASQSSMADAEFAAEGADQDVIKAEGTREASAKTASSGEALAATVGQTRTAAPTEPGRRAEGRAREAREADAVVTGNATATSATKPAAAAAQISAVQQAFAAQVLAGDASGAGGSAGQGADSLLLNSDLTPDLPGLSQLLTEAVMQPGTVHRPETPRLVAVQLAEAFVAKGERNVDVALNPEELGRVKMRVSTSETGITVVIQTERAETGDLMRRHINELAEEFRKMGFENVSFEFNGGGASGGQTSSEGDSASAGGTSRSDELDNLTAAEVAETQVQHLRLGTAGLDMRV